ncbi:hypothetical protein GOV05_00895 [Candidatus Woesearchaeota archaeon]|nr:hypothetical protein [Candidatus Woesearchaeota archaeon]
MYRRIFANKKGMGLYIGWVLLMAFMVSLSSFMYVWMTSHVEQQTQKLQESTDTNICETLSISVQDYCQDEYELIFEVTNTKDVEIKSFKLLLFDLYDYPQDTIIDEDLKPSKTTTITSLKHGTLAQVEIIPQTINDDRLVTCQKSKTIIQNIPLC